MVIKGLIFAVFVIARVCGSIELQIETHETQISPSLLSDASDYQFTIVASFGEVLPTFWKRCLKSRQCRRLPFISAFSMHTAVGNACHWIQLVLLLSGDIALNPGPQTRSDAKKPVAPTEQGLAIPQTPVNVGEQQAATSYEHVQECVFFGHQGKAECSTTRWPCKTQLLREMTDIVQDVDNLQFPEGYNERDLVHDRLICDHPEVPIYHGSQLCPEHRFRLGLGYVAKKKGAGKPGTFGICKFRDHVAQATRLITYPISRQLRENAGAPDEESRVAIGTPACKRCYSDIKVNVENNEQLIQRWYEKEKGVWVNELAPPPAPQVKPAAAAATTPQTRSTRMASIEARAKMQAIMFTTPGSIGSGQSDDAKTDSPMYALSQPGDRLRTINKGIRDIAALSGRELEDVPFLLERSLDEISDRNKRWITNAAAAGCLALCNAIAPGQELALFGLVAQKITRENPSEASTSDPILKEILDAIDTVPTLNEKVVLLSQICEDYSTNKLAAMSKGTITRRMHEQARSHREAMGAGVAVKKSPIIRHKLDMEKVDHFFSWLWNKGFVQLMSWGTLTMQFSSGERTEFGKVVLQLGRRNLIRLYQQDCLASPTRFTPLHERTLYKVFEKVKFSERQSMAGLDNVSVEATLGWKTLQRLVEMLETKGMLSERAVQLQAALKESRKYLQGAYLLDVSAETSNCAEHCRRYALSDTKILALRQPCDDHEHTETCVSCDLLGITMNLIKEEIDDIDMSGDERLEMLHDFEIARNAILQQKSHIIRGIHQDQARRSIISALDEETGFIVFDYAMKFLPVRYREKQSQFFGKAGISWEVFSFMTKKEGELVKATYAVFLAKCDQDAATSAALYRFVLNQIKQDFPNVVNIYDKSDNAAAFRNWKMLRERRQMMDDLNIRILETHNNEPQRGKDQADRDIALIKSQLRAFHNAEGDITTAEQMKQACDAGSVSSIKTAVVSVPIHPKQKVKPPRGAPNITSLHSFRYEENGVRVWHFKGIGEGVVVPYETMPEISESQRIIDVQHQFPATFLTPSTMKSREQPSDEVGNPVWIYCDFPHCGARFRSTDRWEDHCINADHSTLPKRENTSDKVKSLWLDMLEEKRGGEIAATAAAAAKVPIEVSDEIINAPDEGFALYQRKPPKILNAKQRQYIEKFFWDGQSGKISKVVASQVAKDMKEVRNESGEKMFVPSEWMSESDIATQFSNMSLAVKRGKIKAPEEIIMAPAEEIVHVEMHSDDDEDRQDFEECLEEQYMQNEVDAEEAYMPNLQEILAINGTLALDEGDYCAINWNDSWSPGVVTKIDDRKQQIQIEIFDKTDKINQFYQTGRYSRMTVESSDVLMLLPQPTPICAIRQKRATEFLAFPMDTCAELYNRLLGQELQPSNSSAQRPKRQREVSVSEEGPGTSGIQQQEFYSQADPNQAATGPASTATKPKRLTKERCAPQPQSITRPTRLDSDSDDEPPRVTRASGATASARGGHTSSMASSNQGKTAERADQPRQNVKSNKSGILTTATDIASQFQPTPNGSQNTDSFQQFIATVANFASQARAKRSQNIYKSARRQSESFQQYKPQCNPGRTNASHALGSGKQRTGRGASDCVNIPNKNLESQRIDANPQHFLVTADVHVDGQSIHANPNLFVDNADLHVSQTATFSLQDLRNQLDAAVGPKSAAFDEALDKTLPEVPAELSSLQELRNALASAGFPIVEENVTGESSIYLNVQNISFPEPPEHDPEFVEEMLPFASIRSVTHA